MFIDIIDKAYAMAPGQPGGAGQGAGQPFYTTILMFASIFVIFYFLLIRPQQKKAKEHKAMIENLKKGDKVITSGGVFGVIEGVGTNTITVKIAENVKVKFGKAYIAALRASSEED